MRILRGLVLVVILTTLLPAAPAAEQRTAVRAFQLNHATVRDAFHAVEPMLSVNGSVTIHPRLARLTVQDSPEVVQRVTRVIEQLDRSPERYRVDVELLEGTDGPVSPGERVAVDGRLREMFPFSDYRRVGTATFEGNLGRPTAAELGGSYRISFQADAILAEPELPFGVPSLGTRLHLKWLELERLSSGSNGERTSVDVLRTSVVLSAEQEVLIGAGSSESSRRGLVLILKAHEVGAE